MDAGIRTTAGAASRQTGTMIVVSEHPESHLFVDLSQNVVTAPGQSVKVTVLPDYISGLRDADVKAWLRAPDGTITAVSIATGEDTRETYTATLSAFPQHGAYDLIIDMKTTGATTNDPGENIPGEPDRPALTVAIPPIQRSITRTIYADYGPWVCPPSQDCDGDGITGESTTSDGDGDHVPASHVRRQRDNVPDGKQPGSNGHNPFDGATAGVAAGVRGAAALRIARRSDRWRTRTLRQDRLAVPISTRSSRVWPRALRNSPRNRLRNPASVLRHLSASAWLAPLGPLAFLRERGPGWYRSESNATSGGSTSDGVADRRHRRT